MKKFYALLSVLIFIFSGCSAEHSANSERSDNSSIPEAMIPLYQPDIDFSIPEKFSRTSTENNNVAYICEDASVIINEDDISEKNLGFKSYVEYSKELYISVTDNFELISEENTTVNNFETIITEFEYEIYGESGTLSKTCLVAFYYDSVNTPSDVYIVTCKADSENYSQYKTDFTNIINSVKKD